MLLLGHRGYSDQYSENTMLAFSKAIESGFDGIETDVHKTKDGVLVLCHDEKINRTSDGKGYIKDMTYEELCAYNFGTKENPQRIPLLKELLELCKGKNVKINLEIKTNKIQYPGIELESYQMIKEMGMLDQVLFSSFYVDSLYI
jgi:glycerophosphoryl diester phosphodiesterase